MTGIRMSIRITSGRCACAAVTAAAPSSASATTTIEPVASSTVLKPVRISGWSSAIRTRITAREAVT
jgi:hypothetical protein